jgi:hypothetical protein
VSLADLQTALDNLDAIIVLVSALEGEDVQASFNGASYTRQQLGTLIEQRRQLKKLIAEDGGGSYEVHSVGIPI